MIYNNLEYRNCNKELLNERDMWQCKEQRNAYINFPRKPESKSLAESRSRQETYIKTYYRECNNRLDLSGSCGETWGMETTWKIQE